MGVSQTRRLLAVIAGIAASTSVWCCSSALADNVLTVSRVTGSDVGSCQTQPCKTIGYALAQAAVLGGASTITLAAGSYDEDLTVPAGLGTVRIVGAGGGTDPANDTIITGLAGSSTLETGSASTVSLADLRIIDPAGDDEDVVSAPVADLSLTGVVLDQQGSEGNPIEALNGNVTFNEGTISIDDPTAAGYAINDRGGNISVGDSTVTVAGGGYGLNAIGGTITATHSTISLTNPEEWGFALNTLGAIKTEDDTITVAGHGFGISAVGPINANNTVVELTNQSSYAFGVDSPGSISATGDRIELAGEGGFAIDSSEDLTLNNSTVRLTNQTDSGDAVNAAGAIVAHSDQVTVAGNGCGVMAGATMTLDTSNVTLNDAGATPCGVHAEGDLTGNHDTITDLGSESAVHSGGNLALHDSQIQQSQTSTGPPAVNSNGQASLENVQITAGQTSAFASMGTTTITGSTFRMAPESSEPAVILDGETNGHTVILRKTSVLTGTIGQPAITVTNTDLTLDSSLVSGGAGIDYNVQSGAERLLTIAASTIDAGTPGQRDANTNSIVVTVDNDPASTANVSVEDSILLEPPAAERPNSTGNVTIQCSASETPSVSQVQTGMLGAIGCATGSNQNTYTPNVADIFADPGQTYALNPHWDGVDSVEPQTVRLPDALSPSATDAAGDARVQNAAHTCLAALQDKGALELPGYPGSQPEPAIQIPDQIIAGAPATFTASTTNGVELAWHDSNGARADGATFTDTLPAPGRYTITVVASGAAGCRQATSLTITAKRAPLPSDPVTPPAASTAILACDRARVTLTDVAIKHHRVVLSGVAEPRLAGKRVAIFSQGRAVARAIVSHDGSFGTIAALPPAGVRLTNRARYQARIDGLQSLDLKLVRRLVLEPPVSRHGMVTLEGEVLAPFTSPIAPILVWQENATCTHARLIAKTLPSSDGHYTISLPSPAGRSSAIYRLSTRVQATSTSPRQFATFSLTEAVKLK